VAVFGGFPVRFEDVFPRGVFAVSVEAVRDFDKSTKDNFVQAWGVLMILDTTS